MFWRFVLGTGWVHQPVLPAASGCVVTPGVPRGFGFRRGLDAVRGFLQTVSALHVVGAVVAVSGLVWLWDTGFWAEVAANVVAAGIVAGLTALRKDIGRGFRRLRPRQGHAL
ncbi:hypothetical protein [Streptomyces canus]|uniref:hypothetical protein n=1 Tax=Streptomyces canus TaxID=58343 RepID=UPI003868B627|nr:hypothetical protein OH837_00035 [Streptomyces canus]WSZ20629.1 hypothetical protein OH837_48780 [Streptomyces canus]WSZ55066.1 hypothetical protein OH824_00025 [Streptomyces canus]WSZ63844.1 hypothetical protein OH824_48795 [Streptomyces canus]